MARLIRHAMLTPTPWKNGGGSTCDIALAPAGAGFDDFDWRLSLATIAASGPFSAFRGVDRTLVLLAGSAVTLAFGATRHVLTEAAPQLEFAGEAAPHATLGAGPTTDLNVMTRRARCRHRLTRHAIGGTLAIQRASATTLLFVAAGPLLTAGGMTLHRYDTLLLDAADAAHLTLSTPVPASALLFVIDILELPA